MRRRPIGRGEGRSALARLAGLARIVAALSVAAAGIAIPSASAGATESTASPTPLGPTQLVTVGAGGNEVVGVSIPGEASAASLPEALSTGGLPGGQATPVVVSVAERPLLAVAPPRTVSSEPPSTAAEGEPGASSPGNPPAPRDPGTPASSPAASTTVAAAASAGSPGAPSDASAASGDRRASRATSGRTQPRPGAGRTRTAGRSLPAAPGQTAKVIVPVAPRASRAPAPRSSSADNPLEAIGRQLPLPLPVPDWSKPIILALLALAIALGARAELQARRARRLEAQRGRLLDDVDAMQAALVPAVPGDLGGAAVSVAYRPAEGPAAGGDFYDVFVPEPGKVAVILGDVTGHGHESLTHAALARYTLRAYLQAGLAPRAALTLAGRALEDPACERFATAAVAVYDTDASLLTFALAGHPPPILHGVNVAEPGTVCCSPPLGWSIPTGRRQSVVALPAGAVACFFSDGLIEAPCDGEGESRRLGRARVAEIVGSVEEAPAAAQELLSAVRAAAIATPDDLSACILVSRAPGAVEPLQIEELEADERTLSTGRARAFLEGFALAVVDVDEAIRLAVPIASAKGSAVFRVDVGEAHATVTVDSPLPHLPVPSAAAAAARAGRARLRLVTAT